MKWQDYLIPGHPWINHTLGNLFINLLVVVLAAWFYLRFSNCMKCQRRKAYCNCK